MVENEFSDQDIIAGLKEQGERRGACFQHLYRNAYPAIKGFVLRNQGRMEDAEDIFQDSLVVFYEHVLNGRFLQQSKISAYLYAIARNKWLDQLKIQKRHDRIIESQQPILAIDERPTLWESVDKELLPKLEMLLNELGDRCKEVLRRSVCFKHPMEEIASYMGLKNAQNARNLKARCMKKMMEQLKNKQELRTFLKTAME